MTRLLDATQTHLLLAGLDGAFLSYGHADDGDRDVAFDDAVDQGGYDYGFARLVPSVGDVDASEVRVAEATPTTIERACLLAGRQLRSSELAVGVGYARAVALPGAFRRRRARLVVTDPAASFAEEAGVLSDVPDDLEARIAELAGPAPAGPVEVLERLEVTAARHGFKPVVQVNRGPSGAQFVVYDPAGRQLVSTGHATASEARRAAVQALKAGPSLAGPTGALQVFKLAGRAGQEPLVSIERTRVRTRLSARAVFLSVKNPERPLRTVGWLFYGVSADPASLPNEPAVG